MTSNKATARAVEIRSDENDQLTWFRASTADVDRHGTIIEPAGIDTANFESNPVFAWGHDAYDAPDIENVLGRVAEYRRSDEAFDIGVEWAPHDRAQMARNLVKAGFLSAVSVGFIPDESAISTRSVGDYEVPVFERTELVEVSLVPVPSNPQAVALMRSLRLPIFSQGSPSMDADSDALRDATKVLLAFERLRRAARTNS